MPDPSDDPIPSRPRELLELRRRIDERLESTADIRLSPATRPLPLAATGDDEATAPVPVAPASAGYRGEVHTIPVPAVPAQAVPAPIPPAGGPEGRRPRGRRLRRTVVLVAAANVVGLSLLVAAAAGALGGVDTVLGAASGPATHAVAPQPHPAATPTSTTTTSTAPAPSARPAGPTEVAATLPAGAPTPTTTTTTAVPTTTSPSTTTTTSPASTTTTSPTTTVPPTTTTTSGG